jgi:hypothetical protein
MPKIITILLMLARLFGVVQIVVGLAIWFGMTSAVAFHSAVGSLFVLVLWIIAVIALFALSSRIVPFIALLWGGLVLWFGMAQMSLLPGGAHWAIRLAHLLVGLAAIGLAETLGKAVRRHWDARHAQATQAPRAT